jgi:hypothetical protein
MEIIDFKGGRGVRVDADHNSQLMLYALGALTEFDALYDIRSVRMTIVQPRLGGISTFEITTGSAGALGGSRRPTQGTAGLSRRGRILRGRSLPLLPRTPYLPGQERVSYAAGRAGLQGPGPPD